MVEDFAGEEREFKLICQAQRVDQKVKTEMMKFEGWTK